MLEIREYELLMKAAALKQADLDYRVHMQAFLNVKAGAKKRAGKNKEKLVFSRFDKFYDHKRAVNKIMNGEEKDRFAGIGKILKREEGADG